MDDAIVGGPRRAGFGCGFLLVPAALLALLAGPASAADEIRGEGNVTSGNEIVVGKKPVRLFGISAPERDETCAIEDVRIKCGIVAWAELIRMADGQLVSCDREALPDGAPPPGKETLFGTCYVGETDLNEAMVRSGWANAVPEQTDRYEVDETDARESERGLWASGGKGRRRR